MVTPTHAFIGYDADGTPVEIMVDDGTPDTSHAAATYLRSGGRIERVTIGDARKVRMYERPAP